MSLTKRVSRGRAMIGGKLAESRGVALVELGIVLPLVMVLLLGMLDFGKAFNEWIDETHLANQAARLAAVNYCPDPSQAPPVGDCGWGNKGSPAGLTQNQSLAWYVDQQADVKELKQPGRTGDSYAPAQNAAQICISYPNGSATKVGDPVKVTVQVTYHWLNYLSRRLSFATTAFNGSATMRLESSPPSGITLSSTTNPCDPSNAYPPSPAGS